MVFMAVMMNEDDGSRDYVEGDGSGGGGSGEDDGVSRIDGKGDGSSSDD